MARPHVVVVGAGFGGLWAARTLSRQPVDVTLIDRRNYHTFFPLLYQVAAAELQPTDIAYPVRSIFRRAPNVSVRMAEMTGLDLDARQVQTGDGPVGYDHLVLAPGSESNFFGVEGADRYAFPLRWMDDAIPLRHHVLACFEAASCATAEQRRRLLTFVVVGGGPTGVEYSGALAELIHGPLLRDFPDIGRDEVQVVLVEATDRLLATVPPNLQTYARDRLVRRHVSIRLGTAVEAVGPSWVRLSGGETLATETVVWTAGVKGDPRAARWGLPVGRGGRVPVRPDLSVEGRPEVQVVGDLAYLEDERHGALPQVAQVAIQQGRHAASNILAVVAGREPKPFRYKDPGMLAVIGRNAAVANVFGRTFKGLPAWLLWLGIHITWLIGFRNRALVLLNWAWNYVFFHRAVRLILPTLVVVPEDIEAGEPDALRAATGEAAPLAQLAPPEASSPAGERAEPGEASPAGEHAAPEGDARAGERSAPEAAAAAGERAARRVAAEGVAAPEELSAPKKAAPRAGPAPPGRPHP